MTALEQQVLRLVKSTAKSADVNVNSEVGSKVRFTAKGFRSLRQRLGLTAEAMGGILGVSAQTIYGWEAENSSPRKQYFAKIAALRGMGKREVAAILEQPTE